MLRRFYENLNARKWSDVGADIAPDVRVHITSRGGEYTSWDVFLTAMKASVESTDARYVVDDVVEHGPFIVGFVTKTSTVEGQRVRSSYCSLNRVDDGKLVEAWALPGDGPVPVDAV